MCMFSFSRLLCKSSLIICFPSSLPNPQRSAPNPDTSIAPCSGTVRPPVRYAEHITTSPQPFSNPTQRASSLHTLDNDPYNEGGYHSPFHTVPPKSLSEPQRHGRRSSAQSFRRRMTWGGQRVGVENPVDTEMNSSTTSLVQRVRTKVSTLFVPEHKVGEAPGILRELRTIIFGSCASDCLIYFRVYMAF